MFGNFPGIASLNNTIALHQWLQNQNQPNPGQGALPVRHAPTNQSLQPSSSAQPGSPAHTGANAHAKLPPDIQKIADALVARDAELAAVKGPLLEDLDRQGPLDLNILGRQFALEGQALRGSLGKEALDSLASGAVLQRAVSGHVAPGMHGAVSEETLDAIINPEGQPELPPPLPPEALATIAPGLGAAGSVTLEANRATALDSAYRHVIAKLEADDPRDQAMIDNVKLSQMAFKVRVAGRENELELTALACQIDMEKASNKVPLPGVRGEAKREEDTAKAKPKLDAAKAELKEFHQASNLILHAEHLESLKSRAINIKEQGLKENLPKIAKVAIGQGLPQAVSSAAHWGYARNAALLASTAALHGNVNRPAELVAGVLAQAFALGTAHKLVGDIARDGLHSLTELGGWIRPIETVQAEVYFPDAPRIEFNGQGKLHVHSDDEHAALNGDSVHDRKEFQDKTLKGGFGTLKGDLAGFASFASANAIRDALANATELANSIHARASASFAGGGSMATIQNLIALSDHHDGLPTRVFAKHTNPRSALQRMLNSSQKLDLTQSANRVDLYSRIWGAGVGMTMATALQTYASEALDRARDPNGGNAANRLCHAVLEGFKSYLTLMPFFAGIVAETEGKKLNPAGTSALTNRVLSGPLNAASPFYLKDGAKATHTAPEGSLNRLPQGAHNVLRGITSTPAQAGAVLTEKTGQLAANAIKGTVKLPGKAIEAMRNRQPPPDEEQGRNAQQP
ncbi:hypothetical protein [Duganella sp. Root1480D1]|uniref:hypothetical protein n=1 Tax=Duganella sp. Root1480D1 TaxID=1736471 RepID=UPI000710A9FE|nr:hypothetical protein [Duganella sp. Root1480D1]KQZ44719.1 hypothetical protein ASD58_00160 [Duganella sp. Root1480D1]